MKHTPGPWKVSRYPHSPHRIYVRGHVTAQWPDGSTDIWHVQERKRGSHRGETAQWTGFMPEDEANAHLIAAAPELLDALETLFDITPFATNDKDAEIRVRVRALIAKAKGGQ